MSPHDLYNKLHDEPFKPFRIRLSNRSEIEVLDPGSVVVGPTSAIVPLECVAEGPYRFVSRWKTVALAHMVEFIDMNGKREGGSKRRRGR